MRPEFSVQLRDNKQNKGKSVMASNTILNKAGTAKADEFYTQLSDIEAEMRHYKDQFKDKVIFCNCDDPYESNFFKYFARDFNHLGLKKLIATCYIGSPVAGEQLSLFDVESLKEKCADAKQPHKIEISEVGDENVDGAVDLTDVEYLLKNGKNALTLLNGGGDFRSPECIELLKEADIVITNPPFSLFREYVAQLMEYEKKFIIVGNQNAITYKEIFPLIMDNKIWFGYGFKRNCAHFINKYYEDIATDADHREGMIRVSGITWYTNLDVSKRHDNITLYKHYTPEEYPHYDNYDAINVDKVSDIPCDYDGAMGVPITFLDKYNPEQFEILGNLGSYAPDGYSLATAIYINGKKIFKRIIIKRKGIQE